jgi:hypothetical protein
VPAFNVRRAGRTIDAVIVSSGDGQKPYLVRAAGPALGAFNVPGTLADPLLTVFNASNAVIATNDNWDASLTATFNSVGAFAFPSGSRDAALVLTLGAGSYSIQVSGVGGTSGVALAEIYELP